MSKGAVRIGIIKRNDLFEMGSGCCKPANGQLRSSRASMTQNEPCGIVVLTAYMQQILSYLLRPIKFATVDVIEKLSARDMKEFRGGTQLFP